MNYLIFGGSGFIGTHTVNAIRESNPEAVIYNLDIEENNHGGKSVYVSCNVEKEIAADIPVSPDDVILNLAAKLRTPGHPVHEYFETNIRGAENVCAFAERHGIRTIVFTSTMSVYGASEELKKETTLPMPSVPYGISKLAAEKIHLIWQAGDAGRRLIILRPAVVFGKGENGNFTRLYRGIRSYSFFYAGRRDTLKACIYVKDLVYFMLYRLEHCTAHSELFNCAYAPAFSVEQIVETMKKVTGMKRHIFRINGTLLILAATIIRSLGGTGLGIHPARVKKLMVSTNICGKKMAASGYRFRYTFEEAVRDWYNDNSNQCLQ
ncbi:MAG: NAD-dependent epimerase/dehydratase family protein [Tannerellaceae bacterium]|jgi:nucleoside-diphosphate-sugar epimerase|nr:NAD-dependent epimerase/dehydratase family protein [Tannerellaceae bacterium]